MARVPLVFRMCRTVWSTCSSSFSTRTSYENQTKKAITNKFVSQAMTDFLKHYLEVYLLEKPDEAQKICQQVLVNKQSREHAEKTRQSIKKTLSTQIDLANRVEKFVDCRSQDTSRREIYIVEGDSAMGAVKSSRDSEYQAIMPVRGKIFNCLKADYVRIFKSDVIVDLIKVMGCGVELGGKHNKELATFNLDNLRFNKIVICTDADVDGFQIRTLVLTMLYRLTPTSHQQGLCVYRGVAALYEITTKDHTYFAYTEPEKAAFLKRSATKSIRSSAPKALGENDPEMMWLTTMNPESRRLIKGNAHRCGADRAGVRYPAGRQPCGPQRAYCAARRRISGRAGCELMNPLRHGNDAMCIATFVEACGLLLAFFGKEAAPTGHGMPKMQKNRNPPSVGLRMASRPC